MNKKQIKEMKESTFGRLDKAVMDAFPNVQCESEFNIFAMTHVTRWWRKGTDEVKLTPAVARQVGNFVKGFMAAEEAWHARAR